MGLVSGDAPEMWNFEHPERVRALHKQFNDWPLAIAAYNAGAGRVKSKLDKKRKTFDDIATKLPSETQMYVPKLNAVLQLREGTTLYLPVTEQGAWLYLGDGHAAQGDGELTGDAMETSMDVTFTIDVQRYRFHRIPRAETATHIMSIGVAGSLDQALRQATSDMARWLESAYGLAASDAALVMGFSMIYDIPDIVPPWVGVSARLPKSVLATLKPQAGK